MDRNRETDSAVRFNDSTLRLKTYSHVKYIPIKIDPSDCLLQRHSLTSLPFLTMLNMSIPPEHYGMVQKNSWKKENYLKQAKSNNISMISAYKNKTGLSTVTHMVMEKRRRLPRSGTTLKEAGGNRSSKAAHINQVEHLFSVIDYKTFSLIFLKEKEFYKNIVKTLESKKKTKKKEILEVKGQVEKIRQHDAENNRNIYIEWSGADIFALPETEEEMKEMNKEIKALENLSVVLFPR